MSVEVLHAMQQRFIDELCRQLVSLAQIPGNTPRDALTLMEVIVAKTIVQTRPPEQDAAAVGTFAIAVTDRIAAFRQASTKPAPDQSSA